MDFWRGSIQIAQHEKKKAVIIPEARSHQARAARNHVRKSFFLLAKHEEGAEPRFKRKRKVEVIANPVCEALWFWRKEGFRMCAR